MYHLREVSGGKQRDLILELQRATAPTDDPEDPSEGYWWLAYHGVQPVAFASIRQLRYVPGTGFLSRSGVLREHRGNGLQKRLIKARLAKAPKAGWSRVVTYTLWNNPASSNSLISCGFRLYLPETPWVGDDVAYWQFKLPPPLPLLKSETDNG